jgi:hypothetical protein
MKYYYSVCALFCNEKRYLKEWIQFNLAAGAEHIYLYDNLSTDNPLEVLQPYIDRGLVTYHIWSLLPSDNIHSYRKHFSDNYSQQTLWAGFLDIDEFLYCSDSETSIKEQLKKYENYPAVAVNWVSYGDNGIQTYDERYVIEKFFMRAVDHYDINYHVKVIAKSSEIISCYNAHFCNYKNNQLAVTEDFETIDGPLTKKVSFNVFRINHYNTKSKEEYFNFKFNKNETWRSPSPSYYETYNIYSNSVEDKSIYRFLEKMKNVD